MKKPNFFIIGAPKCGTTSLATWLSEHPQIYMSPIKEPDYFYTTQTIGSLREYEELFKEARPEKVVVGEASVRYLYSQNSVPSIIEHYGENLKFVAMIRNPIEMAPSLHNQRVYSLNETETDFERAWRLQNEDGTPRKDLPKNCYTPEINNYGPVCKLGEQLERVFKTVPSGQFKVILLEDMKSDPRQVWLDLMDFLEIEDDCRTTFTPVNRARTVRSRLIHKTLKKLIDIKLLLGINFNTGIFRGVSKLNTPEKPYAPLSEKMRNELNDYFKDDIKKIESILNRDLSHWK